jgi:hypothetical protein
MLVLSNVNGKLLQWSTFCVKGICIAYIERTSWPQQVSQRRSCFDQRSIVNMLIPVISSLKTLGWLFLKIDKSHKPDWSYCRNWSANCFALRIDTALQIALSSGSHEMQLAALQSCDQIMWSSEIAEHIALNCFACSLWIHTAFHIALSSAATSDRRFWSDESILSYTNYRVRRTPLRDVGVLVVTPSFPSRLQHQKDIYEVQHCWETQLFSISW